MRRILHCDMDSFFASVHQRDDPSLRGKPVIIGGDPDGRGVVAAASYEVRKYGVRSAMPASRARRLCPDALFLRADFARYREVSAEVFAILRDFTPVVQVVSIDEAYLDVTDHLGDWGSATAVAREIRRRVRDELALTVSVGVGPNKLIAKIASDYDKPDGLTVVKPERVQEFLDPQPVRVLRGVGPATEAKIVDQGWKTVGDLRRADRILLERHFGKYGGVLYRFARGIDERPVSTERKRKSLSCERTFADDLTELSAMRRELTRMAERVAAGLERRDLTARTISIKVRYPDFHTVTRAVTGEEDTADADTIAQAAHRLLERTEAEQWGTRLLGVGASSLISDEEREESPQLPLFDSST